MARIIGLLGGSGAGKSTAASCLARSGAFVVDADQVARQVTEPGSEGLAAVVDAFSEDFILPDGSLDRKKLGRLVFRDGAAKKKLEGILHPLMRREMERRIARSGAKTAVLDCAVLLADAFRDLPDEIWLVTAPEEMRVARICARDGIPEEDARARIACQESEEEMEAACTRVFRNDADACALGEQLEAALQ